MSEEAAKEAPDPTMVGNQGAFDRAMARMSQAGSKGEGVPRLTVSFIMPPEACAPGMLDAPIELKLGALTSGLENKAARAAKGDATMLGLLMAKYSIIEVDSRKIDPEGSTLEVLWEMLGSSGRRIVLDHFITVGTPDDALLKKVKATLRMGG